VLVIEEVLPGAAPVEAPVGEEADFSAARPDQPRLFFGAVCVNGARCGQDQAIRGTGGAEGQRRRRGVKAVVAQELSLVLRAVPAERPEDVALWGYVRVLQRVDVDGAAVAVPGPDAGLAGDVPAGAGSRSASRTASS